MTDFFTMMSAGRQIPADQQVRLIPSNQGAYLRWLFVDEAGTLRSATAAWLAGFVDINARAAGCVPQQALVPLTLQLTTWAQNIVFMDQESYDTTMALLTPYEGDRLSVQGKSVILDIPNSYFFRQPELVSLLKQKIPELNPVV
jgi:predicted protein tyrosine phosphatase